jgi:hypothetical protein
MKRIEINQLAMLEAVQAFAEKHATELNKIPAIAAITIELNGHLKSIRDLRQVQSKTTEGATATKNELATMLREGILKICDALLAYATQANDHNLMANARITATELKAMRNSDLADKARFVYETSSPFANDLVGWFVTKDDIDALTANAESYLKALPGRRSVLNETKVSTAAIDAKLSEGKKLLKEKLDKYMKPFRTGNPSLFAEYANARMVVDLVAGRATGETEGNTTA